VAVWPLALQRLRAEAVTATDLAPIRRPFDALAVRVALIDEASSRLDLQCYQWDSDNVGYLLLYRLIAAADRGVAVRLLIDDLKLRSRTRRAASLCLHPHIAVRFFNPWTRRSNVATEALEFVRRFSKLDRRMHKKLLVADGRRAIIGGRNIADAHYGLNKTFNLVDYDVLLVGAGVSGRRQGLRDPSDRPVHLTTGGRAAWGRRPSTGSLAARMRKAVRHG
jgi:putative cardiolipin synthase